MHLSIKVSRALSDGSYPSACAVNQRVYDRYSSIENCLRHGAIQFAKGRRLRLEVWRGPMRGAPVMTVFVDAAGNRLN
jgi:hypothetical protein